MCGRRRGPVATPRGRRDPHRRRNLRLRRRDPPRTAGTYAYHGRSAQGGTDSLPERARTFWLTKVKPGLLWSVLRDSGSVGGGIVLAPTVTPRDAPPPLKFACGVGAGALCGLATQLFHNAALTAGRLAEQRRSHGTFEAMARCFAEHGLKAAVLGAQSFRRRGSGSRRRRGVRTPPGADVSAGESGGRGALPLSGTASG